MEEKKEVCAVKTTKGGVHCPETPMHELRGEKLCDKCYNTWSKILTNPKEN